MTRRHHDISEGFHLLKDGEAWAAVGPDLVDLVRSPAGFGSFKEDPVKKLRAELRRAGYPDRALPKLGDFKVHGDCCRPPWITPKSCVANRLPSRLDQLLAGEGFLMNAIDRPPGPV